MTELRSKKAKKVSFQTVKMAEKISKIGEKLLDTEGNIVQDIHELVLIFTFNSTTLHCKTAYLILATFHFPPALVKFSLYQITAGRSPPFVKLARAACVRCYGTKCPLLTAFFFPSPTVTFLPEGVIVGFRNIA